MVAIVREIEAAAGRDIGIETFLDGEGVPWTFVEQMPLGNFDLEKGLRNQARLGTPLKESTVARYVEFGRNGDVFPAVIAAEDKTGKLIPVDGNHRLEKDKRLKRTYVPVYVIKAPPATLVRLTFLANNRNGLPLSEDDAMAHALHLIENGMSIRDAAASLGLGVAAVSRENSRAQANLRAVKYGVPLRDWEALSTHTRNKLNTIKTDEGFAAATRLYRSAGMTEKELVDLIHQMNTTASAEEQVAAVATARDVYAERIRAGGAKMARGKGKAGVDSPRAAFASLLGFSGRLPEDPGAIVARYNEVEWDEVVEKLDTTIKRLQAVRRTFIDAKKGTAA